MNETGDSTRKIDPTTRKIDSKGRVTIPRELRESLGLDEGREVNVELEDGDVVVRPKVSRETFVEKLAGCIDEATARDGADELDPRDPMGVWDR